MKKAKGKKAKKLKKNNSKEKDHCKKKKMWRTPRRVKSAALAAVCQLVCEEFDRSQTASCYFT